MWRTLLLMAVLLTGGVVAYWLRPYVERAPSTCLFLIITGKPCPTCGMTRATCALAHGEWAKAASYHPLVVPFWMSLIFVLWTHFALPLSPRAERWRKWSLWAFLTVVGAALLLRAAEWVR
ncbi:MAG: DUF2752 domain-containing protein [bacterium]|nr:DUF2752 domain-containing protein [bacterium]